jgi:hypothetical protein
MKTKQLYLLASSKLNELRAAQESLALEKKAAVKAQNDLDTLLEAQVFIQTAAAAIQSETHHKIARIVTRCLQSVIDEPYEFKIHFEKKRGKTEARMVLVNKEGHEIEPADGGGEGIDLAAFALRLISVLMKKPAARKLLVLDEPFRFVTRADAPKVKLLLESLARELGFQFVIITHNPLLVTGKAIDLS